MKSKKVAAALAFFLGIWGVHRFYLGQRFLGIIHMVLFFMGMAILMDGEEVPIIAIPAVIGFIDFVLFLAMPQEDFDEKYNKKRLKQRQGQRNYRENTRQTYRRQPAALPQQYEPTHREYKKMGVEKFREFDYEGAIDDFEHALEFKYDDPATHFNLACCYSILEDAPKAFFHLDHAVSSGFNQVDKIHTHDALAFLRTQASFDDFVRNDYRQLQELPAPQPDLLAEKQTATSDSIDTSTDLLEQIRKLGELRDKGILTEAEFTKQKKKILNH